MPTGLPSLNALRHFEAAARHLSFKLAAAELAVTPTAVSHQIRDLESYFGQALFHRHTRRLELTASGEALFPKIKEGIACFVEAVRQVRASSPTVALTITVPPTFASRWVVPRLAHFRATFPDIELHLRTTLETIDDTRRDTPAAGPAHPANTGDLECEIRFGLGASSRPGYVVEPFLTTEYVLVCASSLQQGPNALLSPADIARCELIHDDSLADERVRPNWHDWCRLAGVPPELAANKPGPHFNDTGSVLSAVASGLGVALIARQLIGPDLADGRIAAPFDIVVPSVNRYYLVIPEVLADHAAMQAFRQWIRARGTETGPSTA